MQTASAARSAAVPPAEHSRCRSSSRSCRRHGRMCRRGPRSLRRRRRRSGSSAAARSIWRRATCSRSAAHAVSPSVSGSVATARSSIRSISWSRARAPMRRAATIMATQPNPNPFGFFVRATSRDITITTTINATLHSRARPDNTITGSSQLAAPTSRDRVQAPQRDQYGREYQTPRYDPFNSWGNRRYY